MKYKPKYEYIFDEITYKLPFKVSYGRWYKPENIREVFINALIQKQTVWCTIFGEDKHERHCIVEFNLSEVTYHEEGFTSLLGSTGPCFTCGMEDSTYSFADYGRTWAFTMEELLTKENYNDTKRARKLHGEELEAFEYYFGEEI